MREHGSADDVATLDAMEAEHADIDPLLTSCAAGFERLDAHQDEDARAALAVRLVATRDHLARHLAHEEADAISDPAARDVAGGVAPDRRRGAQGRHVPRRSS